ncbi:hypothetical protein RC74_00495 [Falsihalocynthiibacter arcticus]|uniref:Uncharacterized protein n=1 Tax=Falsihalocynthiibacter arcticus TaxID=1579316 RepID=A0A126UV76_9RHOB|nr:hypothetical protein RC74_00495 [Falsihalocynthiibacter arcticus]
MGHHGAPRQFGAYETPGCGYMFVRVLPRGAGKVNADLWTVVRIARRMKDLKLGALDRTVAVKHRQYFGAKT